MLNFRKSPHLPTKEGLLEKRGGIRTAFLMRRVVLDSENLVYFDGDAERGRIPVAAIQSVSMAVTPTDSDMATVFHVVCPNRTFVFNAPTPLDAIEWVDALQAHIDARTPDAPTPGQPPLVVVGGGFRSWLSGLMSRSAPAAGSEVACVPAAAAVPLSSSLELPDAANRRARAGSGIGDLLVSLPSRLSPKSLGRWLAAFNKRHERDSVNRMPLDALCLDLPADKLDAFARLLQSDKCAAVRDDVAKFVAAFVPSLDGEPFRAFVTRLTHTLTNEHRAATLAAGFDDDDEFYDVAETFCAQLLYRGAMRLFGAKDAALHERLQRLWFVTPAMLDVAPRYVEPHALVAAARELRAIDRLQAPRPILGALLRTCRRIYAAMNAADAERIKAESEAAGYAAGGASADDFVPLLTFVVIKSGVAHLASALNVVSAWRPPELLNGESGYYFVSIAMVAAFVEHAEASSFTGLPAAEFQRHMTEPLPAEARTFRARWGSLVPELDADEADEWVLLDEQ